MVNLFPAWVLTHTNLDPRLVAQVYGVSEESCWDYLARLQQNLTEAELEYRSHRDEREHVLSEFIAEIPDVRETKRKLLLERLYKAKKENRATDATRLIAESKSFLGGTPTLTRENVLRAKICPITTLLKVDRVGNISCPFHEDRNPSFQIKKNNTWKCHSCQAYGDVIDLYQKLNNCNFVTAVQALIR